MDIGTGKDKEVYKNNKIPVWGLDLVKPDQAFSVAHYYRLAKRTIEDIWKRDKLPIMVGGTGFYLKAITDGIETLGVPPDWELRWRLENWSIAKLFNFLNRLDPLLWDLCIDRLPQYQRTVVPNQVVNLSGAEVVVEWLHLVLGVNDLLQRRGHSGLLRMVRHGMKVECITKKDRSICLPLILKAANKVECLWMDGWGVKVWYN